MRTAPLFDMIIFGATGDLVKRKLLPALYYRFCEGVLPEDCRIIGVSRREWSREQYLNFAAESMKEFAKPGRFDETTWAAFAKHLHYDKVEATDPADYEALGKLLNAASPRIRVFFLSTAPDLFSDICTNLGKAGAVHEDSRVVLEKPLGRDQASAQHISEVVSAVFPEAQTFRIDHYLGKETVQNLMALRFGNALFEPLWRRDWVRNVQITVAEQVGVEDRAEFYDRTGAMRDMVQNHLLQLLCIVAMEPPTSIAPDAVRDEKLKVLHALKPLADRDAIADTVRGQYRAGVSQGQPVRGYLEENDIGPQSGTETFVALRAELNTWRWAQVPFYLRTGKRLAERKAEIVVTFREVPHSIFGPGQLSLAPNRLVIRLQPDEGVRLSVLAKAPGDEIRLRPVDLNLDLAEAYAGVQMDAYERLLMDAICGNLTLFLRRDELETAWGWIDPIIEAWELYGDKPKSYMAGTWGPAASTALLSRDGITWYEES
ncbi:glucose-6-phosphate dehydrogenase [Haliangium ochraceum]|uniref:Glucose-6-phosphate 1-dehydrogenase n=1 Tax=Haliangium ochraceum (strain DSM 14365 / JCM 11303 / SMP-2) TaxID=502025 RepID=D0LNM0_HALO1|nr:glucose-6-phosphate dehydrogenase [Haliangium ochraceum]ACY16925.1 glucose-6-phosphate 1-dehydrogenase [Haliangium ochraceum DSM 14365]